MTFRLFDYGRSRELHVENAVAAAIAGPAGSQAPTRRLGDARALLLASPHFVLERIDLSPKSTWQLHAERETWLFILAGSARVGTAGAARGEAFFLDADTTTVEVGAEGLKALLAYPGSEPDPDLLQRLGRQTPVSSCAPVEAHA
jgi:mannose-6-phosphate isomerase